MISSFRRPPAPGLKTSGASFAGVTTAGFFAMMLEFQSFFVTCQIAVVEGRMVQVHGSFGLRHKCGNCISCSGCFGAFRKNVLLICSRALTLPHASAHTASTPSSARAKLVFCYVTMSIYIHCLEHLFGITPAMGSRHELLQGEFPIMVGVQSIKTFLTTHPWRALSALPLGKCRTCNEKHRHQSRQYNQLEMFHLFSFSRSVDQFPHNGKDSL